MKKRSIDKSISIPTGIDVKLDGNILKVKSQKYEVEKKLFFPNIKITISDNKALVRSKSNSRKFKKIINTIAAHIKNMINGVKNPYVYELKICSGHFPMKVTYDKNIITISNFLGEKIPRKAKILSNVDVKIDQDIISLTGPNKEDTSQSAANIEVATKITNRDRRVFQDGIFLIKE